MAARFATRVAPTGNWSRIPQERRKPRTCSGKALVTGRGQSYPSLIRCADCGGKGG